MDKKEILARSRAENAAGDEREQSLVQKSRIFGFRCLWLSYFLIFSSPAGFWVIVLSFSPKAII